jgi:hypothetical protein
MMKIARLFGAVAGLTSVGHALADHGPLTGDEIGARQVDACVDSNPILVILKSKPLKGTSLCSTFLGIQTSTLVSTEVSSTFPTVTVTATVEQDVTRTVQTK